MRLIEGGCDPLLVARRLVVHSAEDVGMADPRALQIATSALFALQNIGYPEAMIPLAEAIIYVCEAEKSNSVVEALYAAKADAINARADTIPAYLKDNSFGSKDDKSQSNNYKYPQRIQIRNNKALLLKSVGSDSAFIQTNTIPKILKREVSPSESYYLNTNFFAINGIGYKIRDDAWNNFKTLFWREP
jgi:replication-associated recombination protein RarA